MSGRHIERLVATTGMILAVLVTLAIRVIDWWDRADFVLNKLGYGPMTDSRMPARAVFEFLVSGYGQTVLLAVAAGFAFLAWRSKPLSNLQFWSQRRNPSPDHPVIESYLLDMDRILTRSNSFELPGGALLAPKWERDVTSVLRKYLPDTDYLAYFAAGETVEEKVRRLLQIAGWERRWPARRRCFRRL